MLCIGKREDMGGKVGFLYSRQNDAPDFLDQGMSKALMPFSVQVLIIHRGSLGVIRGSQEGISPFLRDCLIDILQLRTGFNRN